VLSGFRLWLLCQVGLGGFGEIGEAVFGPPAGSVDGDDFAVVQEVSRTAVASTSSVPVYAAAPVARVITEIAEAKRAQWEPVYGEEWPAETYYPNMVLADREQVHARCHQATAPPAATAGFTADAILSTARPTSGELPAGAPLPLIRDRPSTNPKDHEHRRPGFPAHQP
jgi:hypothetical protein